MCATSTCLHTHDTIYTEGLAIWYNLHMALCINCGVRTYRNALRCRPCFLANAKPLAYCGDCGKQLANMQAKQCQECWRNSHKAQAPRYRECIDCGVRCRGIRCNPCSGKELGARQRGENAPNWRPD